CLKAMAKEPPRRYATAGELADDLRRWSKGEAIKARPIGRLERGWRWAKRNPVGAAVLALVLLHLALASGLSWQLAVQKHEAEQARDNEAAERTRAETERTRAEIARTRAEEERKKAEKAKKKAEDERKKAETARQVTAAQRSLALNT